tara:strand:- start:13307 stop:13939 length:633 start_codon:yes stop_codon:yes gene_type:complete
MRLFAYGCSFTYGAFLEELREGLLGDIGSISQDSWPNVLGKLIGADGTYNQGICGASNKEILYKFLFDITHFNITKDDIVVFMWTFDHRYGFILDEYPNIHWRKIVPEDPACMDFYVNYSCTVHDYKYEFFRACNHAHLYCEHLGIRNFHSTVDSTMIKNIPDWNLVDFGEEFTDMVHIQNKHPLALDNSHPGKLAHKEFAELCALRMKI